MENQLCFKSNSNNNTRSSCVLLATLIDGKIDGDAGTRSATKRYSATRASKIRRVPIHDYFQIFQIQRYHIPMQQGVLAGPLS